MNNNFERKIPNFCLFNFQLEQLITTNYFLHGSAKEAFKAYVKAYDSHHHKEIFDIDTLDVTQVAKSFGFTVPPAVDLRMYNNYKNVCKQFYIMLMFIYR